jgi:superfamily II DNA or RNA helicase
VEKRAILPTNELRFTGTLRPSQQEIYDDFSDSCLLNAPVSWGKTFTALAMAAKLGQKTLIVTHTTMLRDQWILEIQRVLGVKAGAIGSGSLDYDAPIVVGNVQTITKQMPLLDDKFGTLVVDEVHHCSATTFTNVVNLSKARYKIGLSGTLIRKDGKHVVFNDYFGFKLFKPEKENCMLPQVVIVDTPIRLPNDKHWANRVTMLEVETPAYAKMIIELANSAASKGYKVLIVGSRVEFLKKCSAETPKSICITGDVKSIEERTRLLAQLSTDEIDSIYGTISIFSEGISQSALSCLILATPINNESLLTQLIGRIVRELPGKKQPLILDINLKGTSTAAQNKGRLAHYLKEGYQVRILKK